MLKWILNSFPPIPSIQIIEYRLFHYTSCYKMLSINSIESSTIRIPTTDIYKKKITTFIFNGSSSLLIYSWKAYFSIGWHSKFWSQNKAEKQQKKNSSEWTRKHTVYCKYTQFTLWNWLINLCIWSWIALLLCMVSTQCNPQST